MTITIPKLTSKSRRLGIADARRYDLPLHNDSGSGFLRLLLGLMALLVILALTATFALDALRDRWESGLTGQFSVEIPAEHKNKTQAVTDLLHAHPAVADVRVMSETDVHDLLSPWLGDDWHSDHLPVPGLISVTLKEGAEPNLDTLQKRLHDQVQGVRVDAHESWLTDVMRFTGALTFAAALLTLVVTATVVIAVIGGVRTRMEIHREELQLLHLMGATDPYIARQLMRHSFILALQGAAIGAAAAIMIILLAGWIAGEMAISLLPDFRLEGVHWALLLACPPVLALMAMLTARVTALHELRRMP